MKRLATIGAVGTIMMLSVTPITIAHADPIINDTLTINNGTKCPLEDDSKDPAVGETRCNFPDGFNPAKGRVELTEADGTISDILWTHIPAVGEGKPHFHYISDISGKIDLTTLKTVYPDLFDDHKGDFTTLLGKKDEKDGDIDLSKLFGFDENSKMVVVRSAVTEPEPATLSLLLVGLAGLGYRLRRRKL